MNDGGQPATSKVDPEKRIVPLYWSCFFLGLGFFTPHGALFSAVDYFDEIYPDKEPLRWISLFYFPTSFVAIIVNALYPARDRGHRRIQWGFLLFIFSVLFIPLVDLVLIDDEGSDLTFGLLLGTVVFIGIGYALIEACSASVTLFLPKIYNRAYQKGIGVASLVMVILRAVAKAAFTDSTNGLRQSARVFFIASSLVCVSSYLAEKYIIMPSPFYDEADQTEQRNEEEPLLSSEGGPAIPDSSAGTILKKWWQAAKRLKKEALSIFVTFVILLTVYPGIASDVHSETLGDWYSVMVVAVFAIGDTGSRQVPIAWTITEENTVTFMAFARVLFVPFIFAVEHWTNNPFVIFVVMSAFAWSYGYETLCMFGAIQKKLEGAEDSFAGGNVIALSLTGGMSVGALASILWAQYS